MIVDEKKPVSTPGDVADDRAASGYLDLNIRGTAVAWDIVNGDVSVVMQDGLDFAYRGFDFVCASVESVHVGERGDESDGAVPAHSEVADIVEEDHARGAVAIDWIAKQTSDDNVRTTGLGDDGRAERIVIAAEAFQPIR